MTLYLEPNRPGPLEYFLSICIYWQGHKLSIKHPRVYYVPQLCLSVCVCFHLSGCWKVCHITIEMRGANGGSCRHDTPAQNFLLLQEETEESFSISSSLFFPPPPLKCVTLFFFLPTLSLSLYNCPWMPLLPFSFVHSCDLHHTQRGTLT